MDPGRPRKTRLNNQILQYPNVSTLHSLCPSKRSFPVGRRSKRNQRKTATPTLQTPKRSLRPIPPNPNNHRTQKPNSKRKRTPNPTPIKNKRRPSRQTSFQPPKPRIHPTKHRSSQWKPTVKRTTSKANPLTELNQRTTISLWKKWI